MNQNWNWNRQKEAVLNLVYPHCCPICHEILKDQKSLICRDCQRELSPIREPRCKKCGRPVGEMEEFCGDCQKQQRHFQEGRGIYLYDDKMRTSVLRYKYGGRREYGSFFAAAMCHYARCEILRWKPDLILPIPLHKKTRRQRGFNQAELLAERIGACYGIPVSSAVLAKRQQTHSQKKLSEEERRLNLKKAFFVERPVKNLRILLIDDVFTTGSTIDAAAQCLCKAGAAEIFFLTLCIAVREVPVADVTVHADV